MARIIVVGAGVVGVASAYMLCKAGHQVTLVDRNAGPCAGASVRNGAQLSYAYGDALASPSLLSHMPGILLGRDPAYRVRLHAVECAAVDHGEGHAAHHASASAAWAYPPSPDNAPLRCISNHVGASGAKEARSWWVCSRSRALARFLHKGQRGFNQINFTIHPPELPA